MWSSSAIHVHHNVWEIVFSLMSHVLSSWMLLDPYHQVFMQFVEIMETRKAKRPFLGQG